MYSNASVYNEYHSMQFHDTKNLLSSVVSLMDWRNESEDVVMDVGCGPGSSCRHLLLPFFPNVKKVIAVDIIPSMIEFAKEKNGHSKIEYHVANILDRSTLENWTQEISKIISIYCFNWVRNQRLAFQNIYRLLRPGGEAVILFVLSTAFWDSFDVHVKNEKWNKYLKDVDKHIPDSHYRKYDASFYNQMLKDIGFIVLICEEERRTFTYPSEEDCREALASRCPFTDHIPDELKEEFKEDVFQAGVKYNGRSADGRPVLQYTVLTLLIRKPDTWIH